MDYIILKLNWEPLKQIMLDLKALKHAIQNLEGTIPSCSLIHKTCEEVVTTPNLDNSTVFTNFEELFLEGGGNSPEWLITIAQIYNALLTAVNFLETSLEETGAKCAQKKLSCRELIYLTDETINIGHSTQETNTEQMLFTELQPDTSQIVKTKNKEKIQMEVKEILDTVNKVNTVTMKTEDIVLNYTYYINQIKISDTIENFHDEKTKLSFEKTILHHKEYINLLQQCKYIEVEIKTTNNLLNHLNNEMSKKIHQLTESLSSISQQNTKFHFAAVVALNQINNMQERIRKLGLKKTCFAKKLHEKEIYFEKITSDGVNLNYCLNSFLEFEKMTQQHFQRKSTSVAQNHDQLVTILSTKREELRQIECMINDNNNTIILPVKKEIINWKNAYQEATKEIEELNKSLYLLKKKKKQLNNEDTILEDGLEVIRSRIVMQKDVLKKKKKKCNQSKRELERKYKEVKARLQRIIHAIAVDDLCYTRLKMSDNDDTFKKELKMLLTGHNECRARKQHTTMMAEQIKDSIKIIYNDMMCLTEISQLFRNAISCEVITFRNRHSTCEQGILFLQQKEHILKENIASLQKDITGIQQSKEYSALIILIIQINIRSMTLKLNMWKKEKIIGMDMLGFRFSMASQDVEEKTKESRSELFILYRHNEMAMMINETLPLYLLFIYLHYNFILVCIYTSIYWMYYESKILLLIVQYIKCQNNRISIKLSN